MSKDRQLVGLETQLECGHDMVLGDVLGAARAQRARNMRERSERDVSSIYIIIYIQYIYIYLHTVYIYIYTSVYIYI